MQIIDSHVHLGQGIKMQLDADALLRQMDAAGVEFAIVCPMDRFLAVANREGNEYIAREVRSHPDRFAGMASANPWFGDAAVNELRRALESGLTGVKLHPVLQGFRLADPIINPLLDVAREYDVPVYVHTGTGGIAEPFHAVELARKYPSVNFIMGHAGASDYYNDMVRALEFANNLWIETSRNGPANFCHWQLNHVNDKVVFGSNAPEYIPGIEISNLKDVFTDISDQKRIFSDSVKKVYKGRLPL
jgi:predicted TIM-barrel fold metal-dependent hydrolase